MMKDRFLTFRELEQVFQKNKIPEDIQKKEVVGVYEVSDCAILIENSKINGMYDEHLYNCYKNIETILDSGDIWMLELDSVKLSSMLLVDDFYISYCNKSINPYLLTKRINLYYQDGYSYWSEDIYYDAFD